MKRNPPGLLLLILTFVGFSACTQVEDMSHLESRAAPLQPTLVVTMLTQYQVRVPKEHAGVLQTYADRTRLRIRDDENALILGPTPSAYEAVWLSRLAHGAQVETTTHLSPFHPSDTPPHVAALALEGFDDDAFIGSLLSQHVDGAGEVWFLGIRFPETLDAGVNITILDRGNGNLDVIDRRDSWPNDPYLNPRGLLLLVSSEGAVMVGRSVIVARGSSGALHEGVQWILLEGPQPSRGPLDGHTTSWFKGVIGSTSQDARDADMGVVRMNKHSVSQMMRFQAHFTLASDPKGSRLSCCGDAGMLVDLTRLSSLPEQGHQALAIAP